MSAPARPRRALPVGGVIIVTLAVVTGACSSNPSPPRSGAEHPPSTAGTAPGSSTSSPATTTPTSSASWLTYGGSFSRTSLDSTDPAFGHEPDAAWTSPAVDGPVYGEPLLYKGQVFVATENDTVYALSGATGAVEWSDHLATPVPSGMLPCGDIAPTVGITSTMVIDPSSGTLFASAALLSGASVKHAVYALDLATHRLLWSRDVDQAGWNAAAQLQRAGLALSAGHVVVGFGGNYGDCGNYHGWVVGVPESGSGSLLAYRVPTAREGAIWAPAGVTVDAAGDVYVVTGNGEAGPGEPFDHGDSVIELSPALTETRYFAPSNWAQDNADDGDLGSTAVMLLDASSMFIVGKQRTAYLLAATSLGGIGGQQASTDVCNSQGGNAYLAPDAYVVCPDDGTIDQVRVGAGAALARGWTWTSPTGGASSPTIAGGALWTVDIGASVLYGVDLSTGTTRFTLPLTTGAPPHFAAVSAAGGMLVVAGASRVEAFR
ncbi:MAG: PQQ-binding-like beta-propeller repeat protein [Acidimicrobiales bacterium]|nr:PQQ-binding-like beta-propeller repeat protein [Acidimicrobiales bacterium]